MEDLRPDGVLKNFRTVYIYIYIILVRAAESRLRYDEIITHCFSNHRILYKQDSSFTIRAERWHRRRLRHISGGGATVVRHAIRLARVVPFGRRTGVRLASNKVLVFQEVPRDTKRIPASCSRLKSRVESVKIAQRRHLILSPRPR